MRREIKYFINPPYPEITNLGKLGLSKANPIVILSRASTPGVWLLTSPWVVLVYVSSSSRY